MHSTSLVPTLGRQCESWRAHAVGVLSFVVVAHLLLATADQVAAQNSTAPPPAAKSDNTKANAKASSSSPTRRASKGSQSIAVLVNDEPITKYEVQKRRELMALSGDIESHVKRHFGNMIKDPKTTARLKAILQETIKANEGKSKDEVIKIFEQRKRAYAQQLQKKAVAKARASVLPPEKEALDGLIEERLKIQEAKRLNVLATDEQVNSTMAQLAKRNKMTPKEFAQHLKKVGASVSIMKQRFRASMSWSNVIRARFGQRVSVSNSDIDKLVGTGIGEDEVELGLQRILLTLPGKADQKQVAQRLREAETLRAKFTDCKVTSALASGVREARFQDLGKRRSASIPEPTRSLLRVAGKGEMLPPSLGEGGVELWAVCDRTTIKAAQVKRDEVQNELRQKEFDILAKRHLKDLRQDAHIEYR